MFQSTADAEYPLPVALMGFEPGENLFLSDTTWREPIILMMMRKGPFYIASERGQHGETQSVIAIDQAHPKATTSGGEALFLEQGGHSPYLEKIVQLLERIEASHPHTLAFAKTLNDMALITPVDLKVTNKDGEPRTLTGFYGLDEDKLLTLSGDALSRLNEAGYLVPLFMVVASQSQLSRLLRLKTIKFSPMSALPEPHHDPRDRYPTRYGQTPCDGLERVSHGSFDHLSMIGHW